MPGQWRHAARGPQGLRGGARRTGRSGGTNQPAQPPDFINIKVEELVGDRPFGNLDDYISQNELKALSDSYKRVAGFALADVGRLG